MTPTSIAIFGQPKTGTTGLFHKIRNSLPAGTPLRTLFEPWSFQAEPGDAERVVLAKVMLLSRARPGADYDSFLWFDRRIYIVRDPRDWIVSSTLFSVQQESTVFGDDRLLADVIEMVERKQRDPASVSLVALLSCIGRSNPKKSIDRMREWIPAQLRWLMDIEAHLGAHRLRYEDFVAGRLSALEAYLGMRLAAEATVDAEFSHVPRTLGSGDWKNWFLDEDIAFFRPLFEPYLRRFGYADDWQVHASPAIKAENGSEYLRRIIAWRRARPDSVQQPPGDQTKAAARAR